MTEQRIKELRELCEAATPGPWARNEQGEEEYDDIGSAQNGHHVAYVGSTDANAKFIMEARTAVPELLDENERLHAELAKAEHYRDFNAAGCADLENQLAAAQAERDAAVKCIRDTETYIQLGSRKYAEKTISDWRGLCAENAPEGGNGDG